MVITVTGLWATHPTNNVSFLSRIEIFPNKFFSRGFIVKKKPSTDTPLHYSIATLVTSEISNFISLSLISRGLLLIVFTNLDLLPFAFCMSDRWAVYPELQGWNTLFGRQK